MTGMQLLTDRAQAHRVGLAEFARLREGRFDGTRYELLDGEVLVTPSPSPRHQGVVTELVLKLGHLVRAEWWLLAGPVDVVLPVGQETILIPDLLIADRARITEKNHDGAPVLVVEVLSPTTWQRDFGDKMAAYAQAGVRHYWVVAPAVPSITVFVLSYDGDYTELAHAEGAEPVHVTEPVELTLRPADLVG